jgi:hypothetical protein
MARKTYRRKTHRRRVSRRRQTRKRGGECAPCSAGLPKMFGGRGGLGGSDLGRAYTTGASQTLYQMTGQTPGLSSGGRRRRNRSRRN